MMSGHLHSRGLVLQQDHVPTSLTCVEPLGSAGQWSRTVTRLTYSVPTLEVDRKQKLHFRPKPKVGRK